MKARRETGFFYVDSLGRLVVRGSNELLNIQIARGLNPKLFE